MANNFNVYVLATCRSHRMSRGTLLVWDSIRVGFPSAYIRCVLNGPMGVTQTSLINKLRNQSVDVEKFTQRVKHSAWLEYMVKNSGEPFWVCDTDQVFHSSIEDWGIPQAWLMGRLIPEFYEAYVGAITQPRLHTSLLYIDPIQVRGKIKEYLLQFPEEWDLLPHPNLFYPEFVPCGPGPDGKVVTKFYDCLSKLYLAISGTPFTEDQLNCYDHLHCGTYADLMAPRWNAATGRDIISTHNLIYDDPSRARGIWKNQQEFFLRNAVNATTNTNVPAVA